MQHLNSNEETIALVPESAIFSSIFSTPLFASRCLSLQNEGQKDNQNADDKRARSDDRG